MEGEIDKALNKDQSEQDLFQSAIGCTIDSAFEDMCQIKKIWHKEKGVQGFHLVQSFAPGEISPELAHQIGMEFADRLLGGKFQAVVSTHLNTKCIHNHIVWNSVSMENGKKYRSNEKTYVTGVRKISDELCVKHRLSVIHTEKSERVARPYALWLAEQNGTYTWKTPIQKDIEEAIAASLTWKQFLRVMEKQGYGGSLNPALRGIRDLICCQTCGQKLVRINHRDNVYIIWKCPSCNTETRYLPDIELMSSVLSAINRAIEDPQKVMNFKKNANCLSVQAVRLENEIYRELGNPKSNSKRLLEIIKQCAQEKYKACHANGDSEETECLIAELKKLQPMEHFQSQILRKFICKILITPAGAVTIQLKNGAII